MNRQIDPSAEPRLIATPEDLAEACRQWRGLTELGVDTEFVRERTFYPALGLIQIADGTASFLVDAVAIDDLEIVIPNSILANSKIVNEAGGPARQRRVRLKVQVAYGSDVAQVRRLLIAIAGDHPQVRQQPEPRVRFRAFEDSGLRFELLAWVDEPVLRGRVLDALNTEVYQRFNTEGIEFPYPKRDLYLRQMPESPFAGATPERPASHPGPETP